jgi:hypothetical protein
LTINKDATAITLDAKTEGMNFDCANNSYKATLKDTVTNLGISGVSLRLTVGTQTATATTDNNGVATFTATLDQNPGVVTEKVELDAAWADTNRIAPSAVSRNFTVKANPNVGPGTNASTLYTGSRFFWTTSTTSSTATLTLTATVKDTSPVCPGDIRKAKVSFEISSNGSTYTPVSSGQNLPVGLVDPSDIKTGTASVIAQHNLGTSKSAQLWVRVKVNGGYIYSGDEFNVPVTVAVPGQLNTMLAGGTLTNDGVSLASGSPLNIGNVFFANGSLGVGDGLNSDGLLTGSVDFGGQVAYTRTLTNPQGQLTLQIYSRNKPNGEPDTKMHTYEVKSNAIADLVLVGNIGGKTASFSSKTNVYEVTGNTKVGLDGGGTMQFRFTQPGGSYQVSSGTGNSNVTLTCPSTSNGCASVIVYKSNTLGGGVWFSSAWGPVTTGGTPQTVGKTLKPNSGTTSIN